MTTEYSIQKMVSDGTLSTITLGIQYLQRNDIYMRIAGEETPQSGAPSGYTWSFLDNTTLKILPVVPNGVGVVVYRRTDVDAMYNIYSQNAQFDEATIDENNQQLLYIAQEYLEQGLPGAGVDTIEFLRDDGTNTYYRIKRTDGSYSEEFAVPSASSSTKVLTREALRRSYAEAGYNLVDGSFEAGGVLVNANDVLLQEASGKAYSFLSGTPVTVSRDSAPDAGWADESGKLLASAVPSNSPEMFNAVGNGLVDDSIAVNKAVTQAVSALHLRNGGKYLVPSLSNPLGRQVVGKGQLLKSVTGGKEMQNSYVDAYQRMTGQENLAAWFVTLLQSAFSPRIVFSGDSTTAGDGTSDNFKIHLLVKKGIRNRGLSTSFGIIALNKGHSGATTTEWADTYVTQDIADNPDLYVVRWGVNGVKDVASFAADLRRGLTTYRAAKPFATHSVLLMMPNSTYDIPNGRDAKWYEQLRDVYVQAARDFRCAFIDTYAIMQNSKGLANLLMDDPFGDGRGIHPNDIMNSIISGYIVDMIAPTGASSAYGSNRVLTTAGAESSGTLASLSPSQYDGAISFIRTLPANGWPMDGNAITFKTPDQTLIQYHYGYLNADRGKLFVRFGRAGSLGGEPDGWSEFTQLAVRVPSVSIAPSTGYQVGSSKVNKTGAVVVIDGKMTTNAPTTVSFGETIGTIPAGFRPTRDSAYGTATMVNAAGSSFTQVPINVSTSGQLSVAGTVSNVSFIFLSICYDITP